MSFLAEVRRRKVFQVAAAYAVIAWLTVQIVATIDEPLNLPTWFDTVVIVLLAIGFPVTMLVTWAFNLTPDGFARDRGAESQMSTGGRGIEYTLIALLAIAVLWLFYDDWQDGGDTISENTSAVTADSTGLIAPDRSALPNSIAVLLCDNFSTAPENEFFAASLHEEMLNQLFKLRNLNVIARTSVLQYSGAGTERPPIPQIANELGVAAVMECSVAYGDGRIVISVQLIDGNTGIHLWSERYNREFRDVFGIQADIAMNVANALAVEFSDEEQQAIAQAPTDSPEAYALYLRALRDANIDSRSSMELLNLAIEFDPDFALAHRTLALFYGTLLVNTTGQNATSTSERDELIRLARMHAARAGEIDPSLASLVDTVVNLYTWNWSEMLRALAAAPDPLAQIEIYLYSYVGQHETALLRAQRALELDPKNWNSLWTLGVVRHYAGQTDEAARLLREGIALDPAVPVLRSWLAFIEIARGDSDAAAAELTRAEQLLTSTNRAVYLPELAYSWSRIGRSADAARLIADIERNGLIVSGSGGRAMLELARGDQAAAARELDGAIAKIANHEIDEGFWNLMNLHMNATHDPVLEEPEFQELRSRLRGD